MELNSYVENRFEYKGYPCVVIFRPYGHRCGYVGLTEKDKYFNLSYEKIDDFIDCHGGLTYSEDFLYGQNDENIWWIGFDCAHFDDRKDYESAEKYFKDNPENMRLIRSLMNLHEFSCDDRSTVKTLEYVNEECRNIVDQLIAKE